MARNIAIHETNESQFCEQAREQAPPGCQYLPITGVYRCGDHPVATELCNSIHLTVRWEIAAAYAFHIAESQACFDGNKRTAAQAGNRLLSPG
jgi:hypothetical protein